MPPVKLEQMCGHKRHMAASYDECATFWCKSHPDRMKYGGVTYLFVAVVEKETFLRCSGRAAVVDRLELLAM